MRVCFTIMKEDVLHLVKTESYVTGESIKDGSPQQISLASKTQASNDDDFLLEKYIDSAASKIVDVLSGHLTTARLDKADKETDKGFPSQVFHFRCEVPSTYDLNQNEAIREGIMDYMAKYALYKWYKRVNPPMADPEDLETILSDINHRINQRVRPVRRPVLPANF